MLSFIDRLKDVVYEVEQTSGNSLERLIPPPSLVQQLKTYAMKLLEEIQGVHAHRISGFLLEEFNEELFDEGIRVSMIFLHRLGITDEKRVEELLKEVIRKRITRWLGSAEGRDTRSENVKDALIDSVTEIWEDGGSEVTRAYTFAKQRALIAWDYRNNQWKITNLGRLFLELNPFHATSLLLTIDICLSIGERDFTHFSKELLSNIIKSEDYLRFRVLPIHRCNLQWMGILSEGEDPGEISLTPLGKKVIEYVLSENNLMFDTVILSLQAEEQGLSYTGMKSELHKLENIIKSPLIGDVERQSIKNSFELCNRGQYLDGLKVLFPVIEGIINKMLEELGEQPDKFSGWKKKVEYLENKGVIPSDVARAVEIITSRNRTLHGQFTPPDPEYAYPLFQMAIIYLHRILSAWAEFKEGIHDS